MKQVIGIAGALFGMGFVIFRVWALSQGLGPLLHWASQRGVGALVALLVPVPLLIMLTVRQKRRDD
jgi:hypothetical protein